MKTKYLRAICSICAAVFLIAALSVGAFAASSIEDQMASNSAAWWVAHNAGDTETCNRLHEENVRLAAELAGDTGNASYNASSGTWDITTSTGSKVSSADTGHNQKNNNVTYTTTTSNGRVSSISKNSYTDDSINAYMSNGGTKNGLKDSYNNAANYVSTTGSYGTDRAQTSAESEVAVVKALLGLTNQQAEKLRADLEADKQIYESAQAEYNAAIQAGDTAAAEAARAQMNAAHESAERTRSAYNYTGDSTNYHDGGYYYGNGTPSTPDGGGFFTTEIRQTYTITAEATGGGTISPSGEVVVPSRQNMTFTITPEPGARLLQVMVDGRNIGARTTYTFRNVVAPHSIKAVFMKSYYTVTATAGQGGSITPVGTRSVAYNGSATYSIMPNNGYQISKVLIDGVDVGVVSRYTFNRITGDHTISAEFVRNTFTVSASAGEGGSISPSGSRTVTRNANLTYRIAPNPGWMIKDVIVDGSSVGRVSSYTFSGVTSNHSITAYFERYSFNINASAGAGGRISPSGLTTVHYGDSITYAITPNVGYEVERVVVDGQNKGSVTSYTFNNVTGSHSISASFRVAGSIDVGTPTITDGTGASLGGDAIKSGYGIMVNVPVSAQGVTDVQVVLNYDFGNGTKSVRLELVGGRYVLPVNNTSPTHSRVLYIPVETADGTYTLSAVVTAKKVTGETLTDTATATVTIRGNMYEDDFTGDS